MDGKRTGGGWSLQVGTVLGIPIRVHFTFLLLVVWFVVWSSKQGDNPALAAAFLLLVFGCVVLHELGHAAMARAFDVRTREIVLYPIGGVARLEDIPPGKAELLIALAGPAVNLVLGVVLLIAAVGLGLLTESPGERLVTPGGLVFRLCLTNLALFFFNLLPAFPMDGGRVLRAGLSLVLPPARATEIATAVGQGAAILFGLAGLLVPNGVVLMLIALFVFIGASQEAAFYRQREAVVGKTAGDAMITRFETLAPQDSLAVAGQHLLATHQQDFPVIDVRNRLAGVLPRALLLEGLARLGDSAAVLEIMERDVVTVAPDEGLERVIEHLRRRPDRPVVVLDRERVVGMITLENLAEYIEISRRARTVPA